MEENEKRGQEEENIAWKGEGHEKGMQWRGHREGRFKTERERE